MMSLMQRKKISILLTAVVIFISVVIVGIVYAPAVFGMKSYAILTGSMEPTIPEGSMVYVKPCSSFDEYQINDIVTFSDPATGKSFTHRIVEIDAGDRCFTTKGDANSVPDLSPTYFSLAVGKVKMSVPLLGFVAEFLKSTVVKIVLAVIYIALAAIEIELFLTERKKKYD